MYEGRPVLLRPFTAVNGTQVMALVFRFVEPTDEAGLTAEAASIAVGWRIARDQSIASSRIHSPSRRNARSSGAPVRQDART